MFHIHKMSQDWINLKKEVVGSESGSEDGEPNSESEDPYIVEAIVKLTREVTIASLKNGKGTVRATTCQTFQRRY